MGNRRAVTTPPSGAVARIWTIVSLFLPIALPAAVLYATRARREAAASAGEFSWPSRLIDRPLIFYIVVWVAFLVTGFAVTWVLSEFFNVSPL